MTVAAVLPPGVAEKLGPYYVYALVDPRDEGVFYVGKGTGERLLAHGREADLVAHESGNRAKLERIREIRRAGQEPRVDIVRHGLSEREAFIVEAALIDVLPNLTNAVSGHGKDLGRAPLSEYISKYGAPRVPDDAPPAVLIRLGPWDPLEEELEPGKWRKGHGYYPGIGDAELIDATRGWWKISQARIKRHDVKYAVAVHQGLTRAVMKIGTWHQRDDGRRAFEATPIVDGPVFDAWVGPDGKLVDHHFKLGSQVPVRYWPE